VNAARAAGLWGALTASGCTHAGGTLPVDSPKLVPYKAPDIDDITGIDSDDEAPAATPAPAAAPAKSTPPASAQNPHK
jgi:hypothetical protein